jgi:enoyl-CoA hydratase/carnithine racemase
MPFSEIEYGVADRVATVTLKRPDKLNAFTFTMRRELIEAFDKADADDDVRAVVVTGAAGPSAPEPISAAAEAPSASATRPSWWTALHATVAAPWPCASPGRSSPSSAPSTARR